jgi:uncharacterized protein with HEPN domain
VESNNRKCAEAMHYLNRIYVRLRIRVAYVFEERIAEVPLRKLIQTRNCGLKDYVSANYNLNCCTESLEYVEGSHV